MVGESLSDVAALVCSEKILLECELGPVRFWPWDEPSVRTRFEEVIGRHDDSIVARIEDALRIDGSPGGSPTSGSPAMLATMLCATTRAISSDK